MAGSKPSINIPNRWEEFLSFIKLRDHSQICYQKLDSGGRIKKVNPSWLKVLGYSKKSEVTGKWFGDFLSSESRALFLEEFMTLYNHSGKHELYIQILHKKGSFVPATFSCFPKFEKNGTLSEVYCTFQLFESKSPINPTENQNKCIYKGILAHHSLSFFEFNPYSDQIISANDNFKTFFNLENEQDISCLNIKELLSSDSRNYFTQELEKCVNGKDFDDQAELQFNFPKGEQNWIKLYSKRVKMHNGNYRIYGLATNITQQKNDETTLLCHRNNFLEMEKELPSILFQFKIKNELASFMYISSNIEKIIGYTSQDFTRNNFYQTLLDISDLKKVKKDLGKAFRTDNSYIGKLRIRCRNKRIIWIQVNVTMKISENNEPIYTGTATDISSQIHLEEKLKESEQNYKALVDSASPAISTMSRSGYVKSMNPRLCELSGYTEEEIIGKHFLQIPAFYKKDLMRFMNLYRLALQEELPTEPITYQWRHKNGEKKWGEAYLSILKENGKNIGFQAVMSDISTRIELQEKEKERISNQNFLFEASVKMLEINTVAELNEYLAEKTHELFPSSIVAILSFSKDLKTYKIEAQKFSNNKIKNSVFSLIGKDFSTKEYAVIEDLVNFTFTGRVEQYTHDLYDLLSTAMSENIAKKVKALLGVEYLRFVTINTNTEIVGACAILLKGYEPLSSIEVLENLYRNASVAMMRLLTKVKLNQSEQLYRSLAESTGDWIARFDRKNKFIYANNALLNAFGISKTETLGNDFSFVVPSEDHRKLLQNKIRYTCIKKKNSRCEIELDIHENTNFYEWNFYPEYNTVNNTVETVLVSVREITARKEEEGKLLNAIAQKNKLYSIISHDLRSPYNSALGFLKLLHNDYDTLSDELRKEYIQIVNGTLDNSLALLDSVLQWTKEYDSLEDIKPVYFNLNALIDKAISLHSAALIENKISIKLNFSKEIMIVADYNMIYTVFRNLLSNAIKYSEINSEISINASENENSIQFSICDNGIGMRPETVKMLMSGNGTHSLPGEHGETGYGMGLKLAIDMVNINNGKLWIESEPNKGTCVHVYLKK